MAHKPELTANREGFTCREATSLFVIGYGRLSITMTAARRRMCVGGVVAYARYAGGHGLRFE